MVKYYDYENQAWVVDGVYVRCGHDKSMACNCFGRIHEGEVAAHYPFPYAEKVTVEDDAAALDIIGYELGELSESESIQLFQKLIDNGMAWTLQGSYGRTATYLIKAGLCHR